MAIFKKTSPPPASGIPKAAIQVSARNSSGKDRGLSIIGPAMQIDGDLVTEGNVRIEGRVKGTVRAHGVVIGSQGEVAGDIFAHEAVIGGRVTGSVDAEGRLELQSSCRVEGEVRSPPKHLKLDEGAEFRGSILMAGAEDAAVHRLPKPRESHKQHDISPQVATVA